MTHNAVIIMILFRNVLLIFVINASYMEFEYIKRVGGTPPTHGGGGNPAMPALVGINCG